MKRLTVIEGFDHAAAVTDALRESGFDAEATPLDSDVTWLRGPLMAIMVDDTADEAGARAIVERRLLAFEATALDRAAPGEPRCAACGYDLRGQTEDGGCPECGHPYRFVEPPAVIPDVRCQACGEENPPAFEVCWHCGRALAGKRQILTDPPTPLSKAPPSPGQLIREWTRRSRIDRAAMTELIVLVVSLIVFVVSSGRVEWALDEKGPWALIVVGMAVASFVTGAWMASRLLRRAERRTGQSPEARGRNDK